MSDNHPGKGAALLAYEQARNSQAAADHEEFIDDLLENERRDPRTFWSKTNGMNGTARESIVMLKDKSGNTFNTVEGMSAHADRYFTELYNSGASLVVDEEMDNEHPPDMDGARPAEETEYTSLEIREEMLRNGHILQRCVNVKCHSSRMTNAQPLDI